MSVVDPVEKHEMLVEQIDNKSNDMTVQTLEKYTKKMYQYTPLFRACRAILFGWAILAVFTLYLPALLLQDLHHLFGYTPFHE